MDNITIEIDSEYVNGLKDIEGFSHIILIYHRAPRRPNPIGLSVVRLVSLKGATLHIEDVDIADGTPLLDIKPFVPEFDVQKVERIGWLSKKADKALEVKADERFR